VRAHSGQTLVEAARGGAPGFLCGLYGTRLGPLPIPRSFHTLIGLRADHVASLTRFLGPRASRLGPLE